MDITRVNFESPELRSLWEENMGEKWDTYKNAIKFIQRDEDKNIITCFAVYYDESDGVKGNFVSGWSKRKNLQSVERIIKALSRDLGEIFIKTEKRQVRFIGNKLGKMIKKSGPFVYYIIKGDKNGKTT